MMQLKTRWSAILTIILFLSFAETSQAQQYYVSKSGKDTNPGTFTAPFLSLEKAKTTLKNRDRNIPVTIFIREGVYYLSKSLVFDGMDSGRPNAPVTIMPYQDEKVILRGSRDIDAKSFKAITDKPTLGRVKKELQGKILVLDLRKLNIKNINRYADIFKDDGNIIELFMNNRRMPISRYPNEGNMTFKTVLVNGGGQETKNTNWADFYAAGQPNLALPRPGIFEYRDLHENKWANLLGHGVWIKGFWRIPWQNETVRISKMDTVKHTITLAAPVEGGIGNKYSRPEGNGKEPYWLVNLLEEIDKPGEWSIDFRSGKLYFFPPTVLKDGDVRIADLNSPLIQLDQTSFVHLKRLIVEEGMQNGIQVNGGSDNLIAGCTVRNITETGIVLDGGKNHVALSNDVYDIGATGIWLRGGNENVNPKVNADFKVINNHIHHFGQLTTIYSAGINAGFTGGGGGGHHEAVGMYIAHNLVHSTPHVGVLFGSWNSTFEYNEVFDYCQVSDDMGAFYSYDKYDRMGGHTFAYNFVHNSPLGDGLYFDDDHRDMKVYGNIIALNSDPKRRGTAFLYKSGNQAKKNWVHDIECYNNIALNSNVGFQFVSFPNVKNKIYNNVSVGNGNAFRNRVLQLDNKERDTIAIMGTTGKNMSYDSDPGFENLRSYNFKLGKDSRIFKDLPTFEAIPFEKMGLFVDEYRKKLPKDKEIHRFDILPDPGSKGTQILDRN